MITRSRVLFAPEPTPAPQGKGKGSSDAPSAPIVGKTPEIGAGPATGAAQAKAAARKASIAEIGETDTERAERLASYLATVSDAIGNAEKATIRALQKIETMSYFMLHFGAEEAGLVAINATRSALTDKGEIGAALRRMDALRRKVGEKMLEQFPPDGADDNK